MQGEAGPTGVRGSPGQQGSRGDAGHVGPPGPTGLQVCYNFIILSSVGIYYKTGKVSTFCWTVLGFGLMLLIIRSYFVFEQGAEGPDGAPGARGQSVSVTAEVMDIERSQLSAYPYLYISCQLMFLLNL